MQPTPRKQSVAANPTYIIGWDEEATLCMVVESEHAHVARRCDNNMINGTKLLNASGMSRGKRDGILKQEATRQVVSKGSINLKGIWIPFERATTIAKAENIYQKLFPLFEPDVCRVLFHPANIQRTRQAVNQHAGRIPSLKIWLERERLYLGGTATKQEAPLSPPTRPSYHSQVEAQVLHAQQQARQALAEQSQMAQVAREYERPKDLYQEYSQDYLPSDSRASLQRQMQVPTHLRSYSSSHAGSRASLQGSLSQPNLHLVHRQTSQTLAQSSPPQQYSLAQPQEQHSVPQFDFGPHSPQPLELDCSMSSGDVAESEHFEYAQQQDSWHPQFCDFGYSDIALPAVYGSVAHQYMAEEDEQVYDYFTS